LDGINKIKFGGGVKNEKVKIFKNFGGSKIDQKMGSKIGPKMGPKIDQKMGSKIGPKMGPKIDQKMIQKNLKKVEKKFAEGLKISIVDFQKIKKIQKIWSEVDFFKKGQFQKVQKKCSFSKSIKSRIGQSRIPKEPFAESHGAFFFLARDISISSTHYFFGVVLESKMKRIFSKKVVVLYTREIFLFFFKF
jgi:hypothetical protein